MPSKRTCSARSVPRRPCSSAPGSAWVIPIGPPPLQKGRDRLGAGTRSELFLATKASPAFSSPGPGSLAGQDTSRGRRARRRRTPPPLPYRREARRGAHSRSGADAPAAWLVSKTGQGIEETRLAARRPPRWRSTEHGEGSSQAFVRRPLRCERHAVLCLPEAPGDRRRKRRAAAVTLLRPHASTGEDRG